jgi:hypothetical protein
MICGLHPQCPQFKRPLNLMAMLWFALDSKEDIVESLSTRICKPITTGTIFGSIALTPAYHSSIETNVTAALRDPLRTSEPYSGFPRWLVSIVMEEGAVLLAGPSPSGGVSPDFQVCTTIDDASHQGCPELILDTILELLKLSGRQNEPEMWSQSIDVPSHHYHLRLTFTRETYHAFTERVSQVVLRMS